MAKAAATTAKPKKAASSSSHASYKDMIKDAVLSLKERNGSSRQAIKKYVLANNNITVTSPKTFDSQFNRALKAGVENGDFTQPKGPSGPVKLAKKEAKPASTKATQKKSTTTAAPSKKEAAPKKDAAAAKKDTTTTTAKKPAAAKKDAPAAKKPAAKSKPAATKAKKEPLKPAVTQKETVLNTTKSGRVTKTTANPTTGRRAKATPKKAQPKKGAAAAGGGDDAQAGESE